MFSTHKAFVLFLTLALTLALATPTLAAPPKPDTLPLLEENSVLFIENVGQFDEGARFQMHDGNGTLWLAEDALWMTVVEQVAPQSGEVPALVGMSHAGESGKGVNIKLSFVGANPAARLEPFNRLETSVNYFIGNNPETWDPDVPVWGGVRYKNLYPGIDLELTGENGQLVQRLVTHQGADLNLVQLRVEGTDAVTLENGHLLLTTALGVTALPLLQVSGADSATLPTAAVAGNLVDSPFGALQGKSTDLQVQSGYVNLEYATFLGGSTTGVGYTGEEGTAIAVDLSGAAYIAGTTWSSDFPATPGAFDTSFNGYHNDVFVAKLNPAGSALVYATYLGGSQDEYGYGIAIDTNGAAYVTGLTSSPDFPSTPGVLDETMNGSVDPFVVKLNPSGSGLEYATFLGAPGNDFGKSIAVDSNGCAYVTGNTDYVPNYPTTPGAFDTTWNGGDLDAFVVKLNPSASALAYATLLGGSGTDDGYGIAVDTSGAAYVTGLTNSSDFPTTPSAFDTSPGGLNDVFVVKLNPAGAALDYGTFLGGSAADEGYGIAIDTDGAAYVTGLTNSADFPTTPGAMYTTFMNSALGFVVKLNPAGSEPAYGTYLSPGGGLGVSTGVGIEIAVNSDGEAYVTGDTYFEGLSFNTFVLKLNAEGSAPVYVTTPGGSDFDRSGGIAVDSSGAAYITGSTSSPDFLTTPGAFDTNYNGGGNDAFVAKIVQDTTQPTVLAITRLDADPTEASSVSFNVTFSEDVVGVDENDFAPAATGSLSGVAVSAVTGTGAAYTVTVNTGTGSGALKLNVSDTASITDLALNPLANLPYTYGEAYSLRISFLDVLATHWAWDWIERLYAAGITGGCGTNPLIYCPENSVTRAQMAIFLERGMNGSTFIPPTGTGSVFEDVPDAYWAMNWIEQLYADGITGGCGTDPLTYCPEDPVTRAQMAVFLLRAKHGRNYAPPAASGTYFTDVPTSYWAANWIEQLLAEGITGGCAPYLYCPDASVTRAQMAVFLVRTFTLP
jgi:Beta-propeller repeat/S-layer homology domain